jgi:hypothetical protein
MAEQPRPVYYMHPPAESHDAYKIWFDCCLPEITDQTSIYWALDTWARINAIIEYKEKGAFLTWWSQTGTKHMAYAETFARWFICACRVVEVRPPEPAVPPLEDEANEEEMFHSQIDILEKEDEIDKKLDEVVAKAVVDDEPTPLLQADLEAFLNGCE